MVSSVNNDVTNTTALDASRALASATSGSSALGKDAFLKLLVAQISHQDPLKPMDDTQFVAQLAQFSSLEQMMGINTRLDQLADQERAGTNAGMAGLVGKSVTISGADISFDGTKGVPLAFTLGGSADSVSVQILDSTGNAVRTIEMGSKSAGATTAVWDGRSDTGVLQPEGNYTVSVTAKTKNGASVDTSQETTAVLQAIEFAKGDTQLKLSNGVTASASHLLRVNETKTDASATAGTSGNSTTSAAEK